MSARDAELLRRVPLFADVGAAALESLAATVRLRPVAPGTALIRQGDCGDTLYVVVHGRFVVEHVDDAGTARRVGEIGAGELVGEMAMLSSERRTATVRAVRRSEVLELERADFESVARAHPRLFHGLATLLAARMRQHNAPDQPRERLRTVAILPHDGAVQIESFVDALRGALAPYRESMVISTTSVLEMDAGAAPSASPAARASQIIVALERRALEAVTALEREGRLLLLVGEAHDPEWNAVVAEEADLILVVARAGGDPVPGSAERSVAATHVAPRELVLLHPPGRDPSGTSRWLAPGRFARHHHLRDGDATHLARLARRLAGKSIALVLGGGGARGFAHIGVVRALREAGVPIDRVAGTSMGSIMAAEVALDWDVEMMHRRTREAFWHDPLAWDNTLPLTSKITCEKVVRLFQRLFGETYAEDAWLPWACVDVSLTTASARVMRHGPLWQRVRASSALPGLGPPVTEDGEYIIDGAVLNNLPADALAEEGMGPVIAVNVSPREDLAAAWPNAYTLSGWRLLWERLRGNPAARVYPSALWVLQRTVLLGSVASAERMRSVASLYLRPPVDRFEMFHWRAIDRVVEVGYESTRGEIGEWAAVEVRG